MSESQPPADARRAVDEMEEKIVNDPDEEQEPKRPSDKQPAEKPVPGTEEPPD